MFLFYHLDCLVDYPRKPCKNWTRLLNTDINDELIVMGSFDTLNIFLNIYWLHEINMRETTWEVDIYGLYFFHRMTWALEPNIFVFKYIYYEFWK